MHTRSVSRLLLMTPTPTWLSLPDHQRWLANETHRLLDFTEGAVHPSGGFAWLNGDGSADLERPVELWITTRMTHVMAIGQLLGRPGCAPLVDHGIAALNRVLSDVDHGGWFAATDKPNDGAKRAYEHAFVVLAASSATLAQRPGSKSLLDAALNVMASKFWDEQRGVVVDVWNSDWTEREPYGGANANMHTVEAFLAAADVTGDRLWLDRALRIADFFINQQARIHNWRIPEHFDSEWNELPDYNTDNPAHQFRPYGATIGHGFEWSRLCLHVHAALGDLAPAWLVDGARALFDRAVVDGWQTDGFVYTTDWSGTPVVKDRLHWVVCEAIAAAAALQQCTGEASYEQQYRDWWDLAARAFIDRTNGSWHAQLDAQNQPATSVWSGKPDTYHAVQATLLPRLPLATSLATAVARGLLDRR
jgi:sulfoquinovose isomerase